MTVRFQNVSRSRVSQGPLGAITYTRSIKLYSDTPPGAEDAAILDVLAGLATPVQVGAEHPADPNALCTDVDLNCVNRHTVKPATEWEWEATATYSNQYAQKPNASPDPTEHPPKVNVTQEQRKIGAPVDANNLAVANSSNEPIPVDKDQCFNVIDIEIAISGFDYAWSLDATFDSEGRVNSLNDADITIPFSLTGATSDVVITTGCGLMRVLRFSPLQANGTTYALATIQILHDPNGHYLPLIDQGFMELQLDPSTGLEKAVPILVGGTTPNVPRLLDGTGKQLDLTDPTAQPFILSFIFAKQRSWGFLSDALAGFA